jgi:hypothetical protein
MNFEENEIPNSVTLKVIGFELEKDRDVAFRTLLIKVGLVFWTKDFSFSL